MGLWIRSHLQTADRGSGPPVPKGSDPFLALRFTDSILDVPIVLTPATIACHASTMPTRQPKRLLILPLLLGLLSGLLLAGSTRADGPATYTFAIVPQHSAIRTAETWGPLVKYLRRKTGVKLELRSARNIPEYTENLRRGAYDFGYMNPHQFISFEQDPGYRPLVRARDKRITGILVVAKESPIHGLKDLEGKTIAFPSANAFGATTLPRQALNSAGIRYTPRFATTHDATYLDVAAGFSSAGGGVLRTFRNMKPAVRDKLRIIWQSEGHTPHVVAAAKTVPPTVAAAISQALTGLEQSPAGRKILAGLKLKGFTAADSADWDDVRALNLPPL